MKKNVFLFLLCLITGIAFAQKKNVKTVKDILLDENPNFTEAQTLMESALSDAETKDNPETWFVAGSLADKIFDSENKKKIVGGTPDYPVMYTALTNLYDHFLKVIELEKIPNEKGKTSDKFTKKVKDPLKIDQPSYVNVGAHFFDLREYGKSYKMFKIFLDIPKLEIFAKEKNKLNTDSTYYEIMFYAAYAATNDKNYADANELLVELKTKDYERENVYASLAQNYQTIGDSVKYLETLKEGLIQYPKNRFFLENMINVYINARQIDKAVEYLDEAIEQNPTVPEYWRVKGDLYETELKDNEKALAAFEEALKIDPNYTRAIAGIGRLYYNEGFNLQQKSNELSYKEAQEMQGPINDL
ncbi:MAG: tetratricopeptide repeat protein, partial [Bacteroidales bacterium]|nr:tetratricopeptide repeat protein [Bacteroidales bacterium]